MDPKETQADGDVPKKGPFDQLDREELIKKCKGLLLIAKNAKQAKDELAEENAKQKDIIHQLELQKAADKDSLKTMQEIVENLTEKKLETANRISDLEKSLSVANQHLSNVHDEMKTLKEQAIENESLKRQIKRLTDENDELINEMESLEVKSNERLADVGNFESLKLENEKLMETLKSHDELLAQFNELKSHSAKISLELEKTNEIKERLESELTAVGNQNDALTQHSRKQTDKLRFYKSKIIEFSTKLKQLKGSKEVLAKIVAEYSQSVTKWQLDIIAAMKQIDANSIGRPEIMHAVDGLSSEVETIGESEDANTVSTLQQSNSQLAVAMEQISNQLKESNDLLLEKSRIEEGLRIECAEKESAITELQNRLTTAKETFASEIKKIQKDNEVNRQCILDDFEKQKSELVNDAEEVKKSLDIHEQELNELREKYSKVASQLEKCEINLNEKQTEVNELKVNLDQLQQNRSQENDDSIGRPEIMHAVDGLPSEVETISKCEDANTVSTLQQTNSQLAVAMEQISNQLKESNDLLLEKSRIEEGLRIECAEKESAITKLQNRLTTEKETFASEMEKIQKDNEVNRQCILDDFEKQKSELVNDAEEVKKSLDIHEQELNELREKYSKAASQLEKCEINLNEKQTEVNELKVNLDQLQQNRSQENDELLSEMREINEALKNRGDVISKQKQTIGELNEKIDQLHQQIVQLNILNDTTNKEVEQLNDRIKEMENKGCVDDSQMSVSTMSRAEEVNRMRDIEESFEEKYNKLRLLAVKLKKKVAEQSSVIQTMESKNNQNANDGLQITSKLGAMEVQVKNLQLLQSENDRLLDELEASRNTVKQSEDELDRMRNELEKVSNELVEVKNRDVISSDVRKVDANQAIREYVKQIQGLKDENAEFLVFRKSMENELIKLKNEISSRDNDLRGQKDLEKSLKAELAKIKTSLKQTNVLSLEMDAYEKSLNETTQKLETKNLQVNELKTTISSLETTIVALKAQIVLLEQNLDSEKQHSIDLKQQIDVQQSKIKENHHDISELKIKNDSLHKEKNTILLDLEEYRLDSAKNFSENEKMIRVLQTENEKNVRQICELHEEIVQLKTKLGRAEQELVDVHTEFSSYKVRAQSVLRNNQTKETSREKELDEELCTMRVTNENLSTKITTLVEQNRQISIEFESVKQDHDHLKGRCKELLQLLDESRQQMEDVQEQNRKESVEHQETLKSQRLQIDTLNGCYKKQIAELEEKHTKEIDELKSSNNRNRIDRDSLALQSSISVDNRNSSKSIPYSDEHQIDWVLMERQAAEGSENTNSNYIAPRKMSTTKNHRELIPLDELLNNTFDENVFSMDRPVSPTIELETTKAKLSVQESRVKHLTSILAEAEQDLAKLTQLNDVLKEELRRQERSAAREHHLHNLEYLKNVVFKFLTINCGDEKSHLVPVLNTILKLSPDETHKLERVAKGVDGQRKWGSYLPGWSSNQ